MKKTILFSSALVVSAMLASCQKEKFIEVQAPATGVTEFTATIEPPTKTAIDASDGKFTWTAGDEITVTDAASKSAVYVASSSGASTKFNLKQGETAVGDGPYTASYGDYENQSYSPTGANCPLFAESETTNFHFSSPYAVLKITASSADEKTITKVQIMNGDISYNSLDCSKESVILSTEPKVFYIAVVTTVFESLVISFIADDGTEATKKRSEQITLGKGDLLPMTFEFIEEDWREPACVAAGTMITMENGGQKAVEEIEVGEIIRTVDHKTGEVSSAPVCFVWKTENASNAFTLTFEDGVEVTVIEEHGFFDQEERKYAFINAQNAKDYIGHHFYDADNDRWLELKSCKTSNESVDAYAIITSKHLNHLSNGILSMCDGSVKILGLANMFEYDSHLMFDVDKKAADIATYGLTPLEKVLEYKGFLETDYYDYNLMYLNVAIGKGLTTWDYVKALSDYCEANQIY